MSILEKSNLPAKDFGTVRLGLIGAGQWGRNYIRTLKTLSTGEIRLTAVASRNPETARLVPQDAIIVDSPKQLLDDCRDQIDAVIIATPASSHLELTLSALDRGLPVLVEKPMAFSRSDAKRIAKSAENTTQIVCVDFIHLFNPAWREFTKLVHQHGDIIGVRSYAGANGPFRPDCSVLWDWGPHDVAMTIDLVGEAPILAMAKTLSSDCRGERVKISLEFPSRVKSESTLSNIDEDKKREFEVLFSDSTLVFEIYSSVTRIFQKKHDGSIVEIEKSQNLPLNNLLLEFSSAVAIGDRSFSNLGLAEEVVSALEICTLSL